MKVKTCASNFRALVQELTGKYSNVAQAFMEEEQEDQQQNYQISDFGLVNTSNLPSHPHHDETFAIDNISTTSFLFDPLSQQLLLDFLGI